MANSVKVSSIISFDYKVTNVARTHVWNSDEPLELNGQDDGPTPKELFLSALASCISITLRMYAQPRNWDIGQINVDLEMTELDDRTEIVKTIEFSGELTDEQRERLLEISDRCPLAKLLKKPIDIKLY